MGAHIIDRGQLPGSGQEAHTGPSLQTHIGLCEEVQELLLLLDPGCRTHGKQGQQLSKHHFFIT